VLTRVDDLWSEYQFVLLNGQREQLYRLSERLWSNSRERIKVTSCTTAKESARAATGRNLRWVVGFVFSLLGIIGLSLGVPVSDIHIDRQSAFSDRTIFARRMKRNAETCRSFCSECAAVDDIYLCLLHEIRNLVESLYGDARTSKA